MYAVAGVAVFAMGFAGGIVGDWFERTALRDYDGDRLKKQIRDIVCVVWMAFFWLLAPYIANLS